MIGSRSCSTPSALFESLLLVIIRLDIHKRSLLIISFQLCNSPSTASIQTYALDQLLQAIVSNAKSDDERIAALDFGIFLFYYY